MKKFKFRLQSLLDYRKYLEKMAQMDVSKAQKNLMASERRIKELEETYDATSLEFDNEMSKGMSADRYLFYTEYASTIESQIKREEQKKESYLQILKEKQAALKQKAIERKTIEKLKDKHREAYYDKMYKDMQKEMDDMVIIRPNKDFINEKNAV